MDLVVATLAARPDLDPLLADFPGAWPEFMDHDPIAPLYYGVAAEHYAEYVLVAYDRAAPERAVAKAYSVPLFWEGPLPTGGWDAVILRAARTRLSGEAPNLVSALEITTQLDHRGTGLSAVLLDALRANARRLGHDTLVAPVRPNHKPHHPTVPMPAYAARTRPDGLPEDPWLRVHARAGGVVDSIATHSMTITAPLDRWREWTDLPFTTPGPTHVPGALTPVHCDPTNDIATYVEPNVWIRHVT